MDPRELIQRLGVLKSRRGNFDTLWQEAKELVWPDSVDFTTKTAEGEKKTQKVFDMTAPLALEKFASAMETFLTPRTQRWHRLRATNPDLNEVPAVREWFAEVERRLFQVRNAPTARFYSQIHEVYKSLGLTGNGCLFIDERRSGGVRYRHIHVAKAWVELSFEGSADSLYHEYELTARAAVQRWGDKAPPCAKRANEKNPLEMHTYVQVVRPREDYDPERADAKGMRFESFEIGCDDMVIVEENGYHEMPFIWTRYTVNPSETYGRGPAILVLPEIKTVQDMEKTLLRAGHKVVDPPLLVAADGQLGRGAKKIKLGPGRLTFGGLDVQGRQMVQPLQTGARLDLNFEMAEQKRAIIRSAFLVDLFDILARDRVDMTATEVLERAKEKGQLVTPVVGRQQGELLGPTVTREINILLRQGAFPPPPQEMIEANGDYEIEYDSDATRMQKSDEVASFTRFTEIFTPHFNLNPGAHEKINIEAAMDHYGNDLGLPVGVLRTADEMKVINEARAQAAQEEAMAKQLPGVARGASDIAGMVQE